MLPPRLLPERLLRMPLHLMELRILLLCLPTLLLATTLEPGECEMRRISELRHVEGFDTLAGSILL